MICDPHIQQVTNSIVERFNPNKIILFSHKHNLKDEITSFKLVVISNATPNLAHDIYLEVDCDIPFDVVVYSQNDWDDAVELSGSFAKRVDMKGTVLYG